MSYDLYARADSAHSVALPRERENAVLAAQPGMSAEGPADFAFAGKAGQMIIYPQLVDREGDNIEEEETPAAEVNCIHFCIDYGEGLDECVPVAAKITKESPE